MIQIRMLLYRTGIQPCTTEAVRMVKWGLLCTSFQALMSTSRQENDFGAGEFRRGIPFGNHSIMRTHNQSLTLIIIVVGLLALAGCKPAEPTPSAETVLTSVALTVDVSMTLTAVPTATQEADPTATETLAPSPSPTEVEIIFTPTPSSTLPPPEDCDSATFVSDVTIPDGTQLEPEAPFVKTWQIMNTGACTWTTDYQVAFSSGDDMGGESPQAAIVVPVEPGKIVEISISMIAPDEPGAYTGFWRMENPDEIAFGDAFYVEIEVIESD